MKYRKIGMGICSSLAMLFLILDGKTAILGARQGISLCIQTVIPSLLPFFFLTGIIVSSIGSASLPFLRPIARVCRLPEGAGAYLIPAFLGGYPMGAQAINDGIRRRQLSPETGRRMLHFCSNAGPAFLFGMVAPLFPNILAGFSLWAIHVLTALLIGMGMPGTAQGQACREPRPATPSESMAGAVRALALVCGWVICFQILTAFFDRCFSEILPISVRVVVSGILELAGGCSRLLQIDSLALRYVYASGMLGFGGLCVLMQTASVLTELPVRNYLVGKLLHGLLSMLTAAAVAAGYWLLCIPFYLVLFMFFEKKQRNSGIIPAHAV